MILSDDEKFLLLDAINTLQLSRIRQFLNDFEFLPVKIRDEWVVSVLREYLMFEDLKKKVEEVE